MYCYAIFQFMEFYYKLLNYLSTIIFLTLKKIQILNLKKVNKKNIYLNFVI
jgi:hypothetical protein